MAILSSFSRGKRCFKVIIQSFRSGPFFLRTNKKYFSEIISTEEDSSYLISQTLENYTDVIFEPYQMVKFSLGKSFTNADVDIRQIIMDSRGKTVDQFSLSGDNILKKDKGIYTNQIKFKSIFKEGFNVLHNTAGGKLCKSAKVNFAIQAFRTGFLENKDFHERCLEKMFTTEDESELFVTAILANHLFGRLAANFGQHFFVSNDYRSKDTYYKCPCDVCGEKIPYKNSGIGSELLWYGYPDIIVNSVGGSTNIARSREKDRDEGMAEGDVYFQADFEEKQIIESKKNVALLRFNRNISQFVAQAVTFSFYQKHYQTKVNKNLKNFVPTSLIPTLAVSGTHFDIYLYDHEHDILLRNKGPPIPLWKSEYPEAELDMSSVLMIWMILNHLTLKPSLAENTVQELRDSCDFLHMLPSGRKNMIGQTIKMRNRFFPRRYKEFNALPLPRLNKLQNPKK